MRTNLIRVICLCVVIIMCVSIFCACNYDDDYRNPRNGEPEAGEFYTLQEAYDNGWLSRNQLKSIAYYHAEFEYDTKVYGNYKPISLEPPTLPEDIENTIKQTYLLGLKQLLPNVEISGIHITRYYGIYDDCVVVTVMDDYVSLDLQIEEEFDIGGVKFYRYDYQIRVCAK